MLGAGQPLELRLLDAPAAEPALRGLAMELEDMAEPLLRRVVTTSDPAVAFRCVRPTPGWPRGPARLMARSRGGGPIRDADVVLLLWEPPASASDRDRAGLLAAAVPAFCAYGRALAHHAKRTVRVLVAGGAANTLALVCIHHARPVPAAHITALTRLSQNRAAAIIARRLGCATADVQNVTVCIAPVDRTATVAAYGWAR